MMKVKKTVVLTFLAVLLFSTFACLGGGEEVTPTPSPTATPMAIGYTFLEVPDPLSSDNPTYPLVPKDVPVIGESFIDHHFGTTLTRVTQIDGTNGRHEYSRFDPFNVDQSMIVLTLEGYWRVYSTLTMPYNQSGNLVTTITDFEDPRWDSNDPDLIWGLQDFQILTVNVRTGHTSVIKDFSVDPTIGPIITAEPDLFRITMRNEGESSIDKRFWAFFLQGANEDYRLRYIFTWDRQQDHVLGIYPIPSNEAEIDWVGMSTTGNWVLIGGDPWNGGNLAGLTMANKELTQFHRLDYATAHSDVGLDIEGNEVIVMQNTRTDYIDLIPIDLNTKPILESGGSYMGTNRTPLIRLFYNSESPIGLSLETGVHISCNVPGYCVISTHTAPGVVEKNWLERTITLVRLDRNNPRVFYLAKLYSTTEAYWEETHATITNDGSKVVWASNWNQNVGEEQVFLMQLDVPANWMGPTPTPTPTPTPGGNHTWTFYAAGFFPKHLPDTYPGQVVLADLDPAEIPNEVQGVWWYDGPAQEYRFWVPGVGGALTTLTGQFYNYMVLVTGACEWEIPLP